MKIALFVSAGFLLVFFVSCGSSRRDLKEPESRTARYQAIAVEKYVRGVEYILNDPKTAVVCLKKSKPSAQNPQQQVSFFVFDFSVDSTIFEDNIADGSVTWKDDFSVLVSTVPGMIKSDEPSGRKYGYIFDLRSRTIRSLDASSVQ